MNDNKSAIETLAKVICTTVDSLLAKAKFDKSSIGIVTGKNGTVYTVKAFGSNYEIESDLSFSVNQKVAVVAPQNNFSKLYMIAV